jgi:hypothetical protein
MNFKTAFSGMILSAALITTALPAMAREQPGVPLAREANQQDRIAAGLANGSLTAPEYQRLERQQARIENYREAAWANGSLSPQERRHLTVAQNRASGDIFRLKHDARQR